MTIVADLLPCLDLVGTSKELIALFGMLQQRRKSPEDIWPGKSADAILDEVERWIKRVLEMLAAVDTAPLQDLRFAEGLIRICSMPGGVRLKAGHDEILAYPREDMADVISPGCPCPKCTSFGADLDQPCVPGWHFDHEYNHGEAFYSYHCGG